jgi:hypothetical protein
MIFGDICNCTSEISKTWTVNSLIRDDDKSVYGTQYEICLLYKIFNTQASVY